MRRRIYLRIPGWIRKRDLELFFALLCLTASLPALLSRKVEAASIEATLPYSVVMAWFGILFVGPVMVIVGIWRAHNVNATRAVKWLRAESLGLRLMAYGGYLYAAIVTIVTYGKDGTIPFVAFILLAFALTCHSRASYITIKVEDFLDGLLALGGAER